LPRISAYVEEAVSAYRFDFTMPAPDWICTSTDGLFEWLRKMG